MKRSIMIAGHATSISLEPEFWNALKKIAAARSLSLSALVAALDAEREEKMLANPGTKDAPRNLSSYLRVYVLGWLKAQLPG